jgi:hypothetical protein
MYLIMLVGAHFLFCVLIVLDKHAASTYRRERLLDG